MTEPPVDLDEVEQIVNGTWDGLTATMYRRDLLAAIKELRELRTKKSTIFEAITTRGQLALEELENLRAWKARLGPVEIALVNLVAHLDLVHADDEYRNVWACAQIHLGPYRGATYTKQLDEARALLARAKETP